MNKSSQLQFQTSFCTHMKISSKTGDRNKNDEKEVKRQD
jgi:hypothetical protein